EPAIFEHEEKIVHIAFSPTADQLVTATDDDSRARLFAVELDAAALPRLRQVLGPVPHKYRGPPGAASDYFTRPPVFVDVGRQLVTINDLGTSQHEGAIKWYDTTSGEELATTKLSLANRGDVAVSPVGQLFFLQSLSQGGLSFDPNTRQSSRVTGNVLRQAFS